jgi:hypothetical protein
MNWWSSAEPGSRVTAPSVIDALDLRALDAHPHLPAILADLRRAEPLLRRWWPQWPAGAPPEEDCRQLLTVAEAQLAPLLGSPDAQPDLALLAGLLAAWQHHRSQEGAALRARRLLTHALQRHPEDVRPLWFLAVLDAMSGKVVEGMWALLRLAAAGAGPRARSAAFWLDYAEVALLAGMPGHAAWALDKVPASAPALGPLRGALSGCTRPSRLADQQPATRVWREHPGELCRWSSHILGLSLPQPPGWIAEPGPWALGRGTFSLRSPPLPGPRGPVQARVALAVAPAHGPVEALVESWFGALSPMPAPAERPDARAWGLDDPARYPEQGGGLLRVIALRAPEPRAPGLGIELPVAPSEGAEPTLLRIPGPLWVVLALDSAQSVAEPAHRAFRSLLRRMVIDGA